MNMNNIVIYVMMIRMLIVISQVEMWWLKYKNNSESQNVNCLQLEF